MADKKISGLPVGQAITGGEPLPAEQDGETRQFSFTALLNWIKVQVFPAYNGASSRVLTKTNGVFSWQVPATGGSVDLSNYVDRTTNQTIDGNKKFRQFIEVESGVNNVIVNNDAVSVGSSGSESGTLKSSLVKGRTIYRKYAADSAISVSVSSGIADVEPTVSADYTLIHPLENGTYASREWVQAYGYPDVVNETLGRVLTAADHNKIINCNATVDQTYRLPTGLPEGFTVRFVKKGAGNISFAPQAGATMQSAGFQIITQFKSALVISEGGNTFGVYGDISSGVLTGRVTVYEDTFASNSIASYTVTNPATAWSISGGRLHITGDNGNFLNHILYNNYYTAGHESWVTLDFIPLNVDATQFGIGIYFGSDRSLVIRSVATVSPEPFAGKLLASYVDASGTVTSMGQTATSMSMVAGQTYRLLVHIQKNTVGVTINKLTGATAPELPLSVEFNLAYPQVPIAIGTCRIGILQTGGETDVTLFKIETELKRNIDVAFVGYSIDFGYFAGTYINNFPTKTMASSLKTYEVLAGPGDTTAKVLTRIAEIIYTNPKYCLLTGIMGNDIAFGVATATWQANYISIVSQLKAAGITVIHLYPTARNAQNLLSAGTFVAAQYPTDKRIDLFAVTRNGAGTGLLPAYDCGDGIHPNAAGMQAMADAIRSQAPEVYL